MKRNINKKASAAIDTFLLASDTGNYKKTENKMADGTIWHATESNLFAHIDDRKRVISFLKAADLDVFARGTKMPARIETALASADWMTIKNINPDTAGVRSMWD